MSRSPAPAEDLDQARAFDPAIGGCDPLHLDDLHVWICDAAIAARDIPRPALIRSVGRSPTQRAR